MKRETMKRILRVLILVPLGIYLGLFLMQREMVFPRHMANRTAWQTPAQLSMDGFEEHTLTTKDGTNVRLWHRAADEDKPTILYFHGNADLVSRQKDFWNAWAAEGYGVAALSYRGYGASEGRPSEGGLYDDARAARAFLLSRGVKDDDLVLVGQSLGTGVATQMASETYPKALVLISPFTSLPAMTRIVYPWMPGAGYLVRDRFDSLSKAYLVSSPVLVIHGELDALIPIAMGRELFGAFQGYKTFIALPEGTHHNVRSVQVIQQVTQFLKTMPADALP